MGKSVEKNNSIFQYRLEKHHDELRWLYMELYQNDDMFAECVPRCMSITDNGVAN